MMADSAGRLKDCPKQIKMELFPCDPWDPEALLAELAEAGHIVRYVVDGVNVIQVRNFVEHQNPHKNEAPSVLPARSGSVEKLPEHSRNYPSTPADSLIPDSLIPDSLIPDSLIPDSLIPDSTAAADQQAEVVDPEGAAHEPDQAHQQQKSNAENVLRKACAERKAKILQLMPHVAPVYDIEAEKFVLHFLGKPPRADPHVELVKWMQRVRKDPPANEVEKPKRPYVTAEELEVFEKTRRRYEQHLCGN
jgi:hypothetical protein